jgi:hypothetical protein
MSKRPGSPFGRNAEQAARERAARNEYSRLARDEYAGIRELRKNDPFATQMRERRHELS